MTHRTTDRFWRCYNSLPVEIQRIADRNFELLKADVRHPSLHFKRIGKVWSARVGIHYRAIAVPEEDGYLWVWVGTHAEYDRVLSIQS
ncbi:MAG: hypothetical protein O2923_12690 [Verrucomicrobia bacterium]|nr:hypothetical protein [Verrucomicrobiota bacterium]MDA1087975.1 hypothetical protein [Verrucomicrobiota bacterium]